MVDPFPWLTSLKIKETSKNSNQIPLNLQNPVAKFRMFLFLSSSRLTFGEFLVACCSSLHSGVKNLV